MGFFTQVRSTTTPPRGPGTAPLTRTRWRSTSTLMTSRFVVVTWLPPMRPAIFVPSKDATGGGARADGTGSAVVLVVTVGSALTREVVALHATGEALALGDGGGVDHLALFEGVGEDLLADGVAAHVVEAKLHELLARGDAGLFEVAELGLGQGRARRLVPQVTWTAE